MTQPLPEQFRQAITSIGAPQLQGLLQALDTPALTAVRVNALKGALQAAPAGASRPVAWCPTGFYLDERPNFTLDPAMHQGLYYVQEASSMISRLAVGHAARLLAAEAGEEGPLAMLDACAAPGGKTTCAVEALPAGSVVVANELSPQRAAALVENVVKHGSPDVVVTRGDASLLGELGETFDIIAVDAPCSGEGMMRKEPVARSQWSPALVDECARVQRELTRSLWRALRPGGYMVYSTCTFNLAENEAVVRGLVSEFGAEVVSIPVDAAWGISPAIGAEFPALRFIPGVAPGEGLFMALLRKPGEFTELNSQCAMHNGQAPSGKKAKKGRCEAPGANKASGANKAPDGAAAAAEWLLPRTGGEPWLVEAEGSELYALSPAVAAMARRVGAVTRVIHRGVHLAEVRPGKLVPAQGLAMSAALRREAFARVDVDRPTAIDYLRRQAVTLPAEAPRGAVLLYYMGHPLGFVNNLGSRSNNLYPPSWRILTTYV